MSAECVVDFVGQLRSVQWKPGDLFVLSYPGHVTEAMVAHLRESFEQYLPDAKVVILEEGMQLGVIHRVEVEPGEMSFDIHFNPDTTPAEGGA